LDAFVLSMCALFLFFTLQSDWHCLFSSPPEDEDALFYSILAGRTPQWCTKISGENCE
jgi:hypothetical protein